MFYMPGSSRLHDRDIRMVVANAFGDIAYAWELWFFKPNEKNRLLKGER